MAFLGRVNLTTVRARIILILGVGILGMLVLVSVNTYLDAEKNGNIRLGMESQGIRTGILEVIHVEETFINRHDPEVLNAYETLRGSLNAAVSTVREKAVDPQIQSLVDEIARIEEENGRAFASVGEAIRGMDRDMEALNRSIQEMNAGIEKVIIGINQEETMKMMVGEYLDTTRTGLRRELKDFMAFGSEKTLSILRLLLFSDLDGYHESRALLQEKRQKIVKNVDTMIQAAASDEYSEGWRTAQSALPEVDRLEEAVVSSWEKNQALMTELKETGARVQDAAQKIVDQTRENMERGDRTGDLVALIFGAGSILLLLVLGFFVSRATNRALRSTIDGLSRSSEQVAGASEQVSSSSHSLAEGSSEQAASIEETYKDTTTQIEDIGKKIRESMDMVAQSLEEFSRVEESSGKVDELMTEISTASEEQANGIEQVNRAITDMDRVVQQNASHAEESASASEELRAQARGMPDMVVSLRELVDGRNRLRKAGTSSDRGDLPAERPGRKPRPLSLGAGRQIGGLPSRGTGK